MPDEVLVHRMQGRNRIEIVHDAFHKRMLEALERGERRGNRSGETVNIGHTPACWSEWQRTSTATNRSRRGGPAFEKLEPKQCRNVIQVVCGVRWSGGRAESSRRACRRGAGSTGGW